MPQIKLILMATKKPPTWEQWRELKNPKETVRERVTMTQTEATSILEAVTGAETKEQAREIFSVMVPSRKHLTYWLGQIGHRQETKLGEGLDFSRYLDAVVNSLRSRAQTDMTVSTHEKENAMKKKIVKPVTVVNKSKSQPNADDPTDNPTEIGKPVDQVKPVLAGNEGRLEPTAASPVDDSESRQGKGLSEALPAPTMGRAQDYAMRNLFVFADCAIQKNESGVFDVLARNFDSTGLMSYWLNKVGYGHLTRYAKDRDLVQYIRKAAYEIHRHMKKAVGKPVARW
jgi:hypothetical protein